MKRFNENYQGQELIPKITISSLDSPFLLKAFSMYLIITHKLYCNNLITFVFDLSIPSPVSATQCML